MSDLYKPAEIAKLVERMGVNKARLGFSTLMSLSALAGAFIAIGGAFYTLVLTGADASFGPTRFAAGIAFSLGLILVVIGGAELFTGNTLIIMAWIDKKISSALLLRNWSLVWIGNLIGSLILVSAIAVSGLLDGEFGKSAISIAEGKFALSPLSLFVRAIMCNVLVCLAVWISLAARTAAGKVLTIILPIAAFVALGFEHSIANMYLLPIGLLAGAQGGLTDIITNIAIATAGNIVGGAGGVALAYRMAFKPQIS